MREKSSSSSIGSILSAWQNFFDVDVKAEFVSALQMRRPPSKAGEAKTWLTS